MAEDEIARDMVEALEYLVNGGRERSVIRKAVRPHAAVVDEVTADLSKDPRRDD